VCGNLAVACKQQLQQMANFHTDKLRIFNRIIDKMITDKQDKISKIKLEPHEVMVNGKETEKKSIRRVITLNARLPMFAQKIQIEETMAGKKKWLQVLTNTVKKKCPPLMAFIKKS
jgi:hypothetical protein